MKKILVFGERYFHYTDSTVYALEQLGFEVKVVYMPLLQSKELSIWEHLQYKINRNSFCQKYYEHKKLQIQNEVSEYKPDIFFSINGNAYYEFIDKNLIMMLRDIKCKSYVWYMDTVKRFENIEQNIRLFDEVLSFEPMDVAYAKEKYDKEARYLPIGVAEQLFCKSSKSEKKYDVSFVGNSTDNRLAVLDEVAKYCTANNKSMIVFGHYWHNKHFWQAYFAKRSFARKHPDLVKYDEIRDQINNDIDIKPYSSRYKIYIVDDSEKMTVQAQNALLKTIEEPPEYAIIILLTTNADMFLPTILSRCVLLNMRPVKEELIKNQLMSDRPVLLFFFILLHTEGYMTRSF